MKSGIVNTGNSDQKRTNLTIMKSDNDRKSRSRCGVVIAPASVVDSVFLFRINVYCSLAVPCSGLTMPIC